MGFVNNWLENDHMRVVALADVLKLVSEQKSKKDKITVLRKHDHVGLRGILDLILNDQIEWVVPEGDIAYKPNVQLDCDGQLYKELRRMYLFVKGGHPTLEQPKRELLFVQLLESVTPNDAKLLLAMKDHKAAKFYGINRKLVEEAFQGGTV